MYQDEEECSQIVSHIAFHLKSSEYHERDEDNGSSIDKVPGIVAQPVDDWVHSTHKLKVFCLHTHAHTRTHAHTHTHTHTHTVVSRRWSANKSIDRDSTVAHKNHKKGELSNIIIPAEPCSLSNCNYFLQLNPGLCMPHEVIFECEHEQTITFLVYISSTLALLRIITIQ